MSRSKLRFPFAGLLVASVAWAVAGQPQPLQPVPPGGLQPVDPKKKDKERKDDRPPEEDNLPFGFPYDRDSKKQLTAARQYLEFEEDNIPWDRVCPLLQNILDANTDSFFNITFVAAGQKQINRISVKTEANRIIAAFPKAGLEFYQQLYGQAASALLDDAIKTNYDVGMLADLSQRYFHTKAGAEATILLATLHLERGNYLEAAHAFDRVFARPNAAEFLTPRTLFKACLAFKRSGDPRHADLLKTTLADLQKAAGRDGVTIGRKAYPFAQLEAEINRPLELIRASSTVGEWAMRQGNPPRAGTVEGGPPFLDPSFRKSMLPSPPPPEAKEPDNVTAANDWIKAELDKQFGRDNKIKGVPLPAFFPVTTPDLVVFRTYSGVYAVASRDQVVAGKVVRAGDVRWVSRTTFGTHQLLTPGTYHDVDAKNSVQNWWGTYALTGVTSVLYENPLIGSLSHDGQNAYFVDDVAIPPPPVFSNPEFGINPGAQYRQSGELADAVRAGQLVAVNLRSGLLSWTLGRIPPESTDPDAPKLPPLPSRLTEEEADKTTSAFQICLDAIFLAPPLPLDGKLYVLVEQAGVMRLLCLDAKALVPVPGRPHIKVPTLVWTQKLGRPNNTLPLDSIRRYQGCTLAAGEGIIVCPTNSGAVVAVDVMSHSLLWAHAYRKLDPNARPVQPRWGPDGRPLPPPDQLPVDRWRSAGPIVVGGRVILTAYDSNRLECLDLRTGKVLWSVPREAGDLYVGGVVNDKVIVVGKSSVRGYHLTDEDAEAQKPKVAFEPVALTNATPTGHGVGGKGVFYLPVRQENAGKDNVAAAEIWAINVETGQVGSKTLARKRNDTPELSRFGLGNLVFQDGLVFAQSAWELACYPQLEQKRAEMDRLLAANPKDPVGLLSRGELLLDEGKLKEAIADFTEARKNNLPPEKEPLLKEKLYLAYTDLIRNDFAAAEPILAEYETLCEVAMDTDDPEERVRRRDESDRRRRQYLYLLARGREGQGRLGEAFDHYIALANLGEGRNLIEMPDEPNVKMRPDVWARGRIEGMIRRAADPEAKKSLEQRVSREWEGVKNASDLKRLREFVAVFGPYFKAGAEAQLLLADQLLRTNDEADAREAQTHLSQLRVTADEPAVKARATEALARLMVKNQLMEDAVGLYLQLGKEFPDVVVRDGKTGAEFMTGLLTDKRLLPYLEPSRYPFPARMKADMRQEQNNSVNHGAQFEVEPSGDLFPMYKRLRFVFDQYAAGNGTWTLRAFDRATGAERCKFPGLIPPQFQNGNPGALPFSNFVQGSGHLLLVQLGQWVYCLDLAEKRVRGERNLLGDTPQTPGNPNVQLLEDGSVVAKFVDGYTVTLGRCAVLQPGYVALLTRDGLEVVDPADLKTKIWTRRGIPDRTQLYGDARYLALIETTADRRPVAVRLLKAVDGMPVEGSPDSGRVFANAKSYHIFGRHALLAEGAGDQPRSLRLYDLATGKDVWRKDFDAKSVPIKSLTNEWAGFLRPTGEGEVLDVQTGKVVATLKIPEANLEADLKPCVEAHLLADADRFYVFLDRDPSQPATSGTIRQPVYNNTLRTLRVNGPLYAFDRQSGKTLWSFGDNLGLFENQMVVLEQFAELPVIIAASPVGRTTGGAAGYPVVVIEKARGRLLLNKTGPMDGNVFQNLSVNLRNGTIDLNKPGALVRITPDEGTRAP